MPGGDLDIPLKTRQHVRFRAPCELLELFRASASASSIANEGRRRRLEAHAAFWARIRISLSCTQGQSASLSHLRNPGFAESRLWITRGIDSETASSSLSWSEREIARSLRHCCWAAVSRRPRAAVGDYPHPARSRDGRSPYCFSQRPHSALCG